MMVVMMEGGRVIWMLCSVAQLSRLALSQWNDAVYEYRARMVSIPVVPPNEMHCNPFVPCEEQMERK